MNGSKVLIDVMARLKPYLIKIIPLSYLSKAKKYYMNRNTSKLKYEKIIPFEKEHNEDGVNLIGNIRGDSGLGQSCRLVAWELKESGIPFGVFEHHISDMFSMNDKSCDAMIVDAPKYNVNLFHINAHEFTISYMQLGKKVWDYRYNIAFWLWELEEFPEEWVGCIDILDEIWTPSEFVSEALRKVTDKPVTTIPYHVEAPIDEKYDRKYFGLPENKFLFLMMYDSGSMMERKNPLGVLEAFKKAFSKDNQGVGLVIKLNGKRQEDIDKITEYLDGYTNVYFMTDILSKVEVNSLIADVDVFVSMHRAEGFGLVMAEAMLNGTPCIATNWSANTEFMNSSVACMLDYQLVPLKEDIGPFKKGNRWADPDVDQAAEFMKRLFEDTEFYGDISDKAQEYITEKLGMQRITGLIEGRLHEIGIC